MPQTIDFNIPISSGKNSCFISYTREDAPRIARFVKALYNSGLSLWYDRGLVYSKNWEKQIAEKIDSCKCVIAFLSNKTFQKEKSYGIAECRMAAETYGKTVYYVLLEKIDPSKIRHEYAMWWTMTSKLHLFQVENQTAEQIATSICKEIKKKPGKESSTKTTHQTNSSGSIWPILFIVLLIFALKYSGMLDSLIEDVHNPESRTVTLSELSDPDTTEPTPSPIPVIYIYGGYTAPVTDFVFPYSSTQLISDDEMNAAFGTSDIYDMRRKSQAAINEIFARYGYTFSGNRDTGIAAHEKFSSLDWCRTVQQICPSSESEDIRQYYMNDIERENISRINAWQIENNVPY